MCLIFLYVVVRIELPEKCDVRLCLQIEERKKEKKTVAVNDFRRKIRNNLPQLNKLFYVLNSHELIDLFVGVMMRWSLMHVPHTIERFIVLIRVTLCSHAKWLTWMKVTRKKRILSKYTLSASIRFDKFVIFHYKYYKIKSESEPPEIVVFFTSNMKMWCIMAKRNAMRRQFAHIGPDSKFEERKKKNNTANIAKTHFCLFFSYLVRPARAWTCFRRGSFSFNLF